MREEEHRLQYGIFVASWPYQEMKASGDLFLAALYLVFRSYC